MSSLGSDCLDIRYWQIHTHSQSSNSPIDASGQIWPKPEQTSKPIYRVHSINLYILLQAYNSLSLYILLQKRQTSKSLNPSVPEDMTQHHGMDVFHP